jgi:hypothetical protein
MHEARKIRQWPKKNSFPQPFGISYDCVVCIKNFQKTKYSVECIVQGGRIGAFSLIMQPIFHEFIQTNPDDQQVLLSLPKQLRTDLFWISGRKTQQIVIHFKAETTRIENI